MLFKVDCHLGLKGFSILLTSIKYIWEGEIFMLEDVDLHSPRPCIAPTHLLCAFLHQCERGEVLHQLLLGAGCRGYRLLSCTHTHMAM